MTLPETRLICFSPTLTSLKVGRAIVRGIGAERTTTLDLTRTAQEDEIVLPPDLLAVIAVPVYGGKVAPTAFVRLQRIKAQGTPAVLVAVYGNRDYEGALRELDGLARLLGFVPVAAATFVGEHSYSTAQWPVAVGRPDSADLEEAAVFGRAVSAKLSGVVSVADLPALDVDRIPRPRQPFLPRLRFIRDVVRLRRSGQPMPQVPLADPERCTHCGACVRLCPVGAIAPGDELHTDAGICIRCCACVKGCPMEARRFDTPFSRILSTRFPNPKENCTLL